MGKKTLAEASGVKASAESLLAAPWPYMLAGILIIAAAAWSLFGGSAEKSQSAAAQQQARQVSTQMGRVVQEIREMLRSDAVQNVAREVSAGDARVPELLSEMRAQIPEVTDIEVFDDDAFMTDFARLGENGFIVLDMLASANDDELSPVQIVQKEGLQYVAAASTIGRAVQEQGFFVVYLDPSYLLDLFSVQQPEAGFVSLEHRAGSNAPAELRTIGSGIPSGFTAIRMPVQDSLFQIAYPSLQGEGLLGLREQAVLFTIGLILLLYGVVRHVQLRRLADPGETMPEHFATLQGGMPPTLADPPSVRLARLKAARQQEASESPQRESENGAPPSPVGANAAGPTQPEASQGERPEPMREPQSEPRPDLRPEPRREPRREPGPDLPSEPPPSLRPKAEPVGQPEPAAEAQKPTPPAGVSPLVSTDLSHSDPLDGDAPAPLRPADDRVAPPDLSASGPPLVGRISQPATTEDLDLSPKFSSDSGPSADESDSVIEPTEPTESAEPADSVDAVEDSDTAVVLKSEIFRAYDIRGIVGQSLDRGVAYQIGQAIGSEATDRLATPVAVGRDGRHSGPELVDGLIEGMLSVGCDVIDIGAVPTGVLYFAAYELGKGSGVMVTGSHNPPDYNGFKTLLGGHTLAGDDIFGLFERIRTGRVAHGEGQRSEQDAIAPFIQRITGDIQLKRPLKVVADCGNGIGGVCAVEVLQGIGAEVIPLFEDVDGNFPNHHPDPSEPKNLQDLIESVEQTNADLGLAFDGDADRLGVVTPDGSIVFSDRIMMLYAREVLSRKPGSTIIYDVKCTGHLDTVIREAGGNPEMYKTGHSLMKNRMKEVGAPLAGEMSGHFFFEDRWYGFDCGIYSACRLLEILASEAEAPETVLHALPNSVSTPELKVELEEGENHAFIETFKQQARFPGARINVIDGVRADFADGWGLVRASNTTPILVLRFDADSEEALHNVKEAFRAQLLAVRSDLVLPF